MVIRLGTSGKDTLTGSKESDILYGEDSNDIIKGVEGEDIIGGGAGDDTLTGGAETDYFVFSLDEGIDTVSDFSEEDQIIIDEQTFDASSTDQFSYDNDTGELSFDASPDDSIAAVPFASLPLNLGSAFDAKENIILPLADSDIVTDTGGRDIVNSFNSDNSNVETEGEAFFSDPLII